MKKKQKILIVHNYYQIPGGEDTVVANEKKLLESHGHEVLLYSRNNSELNKMSKGRKLLLPFTTIFNPRTYRDIRRIIKKEHIDVVHVHNTLNLISPAVYYAALSYKVPVVQTIHNFRLLCPGATFYRDGHICEDCVGQGLMCAVRHGCYRGSKLQTFICVVSTKIHRMLGVYGKINYICLTEFNKEKLLQLNKPGRKQIIDPARVYVKPNFVEAESEIVPYEKRKNQFIYAGRLDKLKGIEILFEAWKRISNIALEQMNQAEQLNHVDQVVFIQAAPSYEVVPKLLVCGTGPMENWCKEFIEVNPECNIEMLGFVPNEEARKLIGKSKALILPTQWYEGFPMTIVEAYSVGTPVVGSDIGNVGSLIEEGATGWKFDAGSVGSLMAVVNKARQQNEIGGESVKHVYEEKYTAGKNYELLCGIYERLC